MRISEASKPGVPFRIHLPSEALTWRVTSALKPNHEARGIRAHTTLLPSNKKDLNHFTSARITNCRLQPQAEGIFNDFVHDWTTSLL